MLVLFVVILIVSVACSSDDASKKDDAIDDDTSNGKTLIFGRGSDSASLDPSRAVEGETFRVTKNIFEKLLDFEDDSMEVVPSLAKDWDISDDGLIYTFELEEEVTFHDGTDFNADAVVKNFERWAGGDSERFPYYQSMFGGYEGDEDHLIESVEAEDEFTVVFTLQRPQASFLKNIAMDMSAIASPTAFEDLGDDEFEKNPVGTGPFQFVEWKQNDSITVEKHEDYWVEDLPKLDSIVFRSIPDNSARINALKAGEIDLADGINPYDGEQIENDDNLQLIERPSMNVGYLGLTVTREPFDQKEVRQAMNYAIDRESIIEAFFEGYAEIAANPMPPIIEGYNEDIDAYPYDPEKAKELLKEAGLEDGFDMELWAMPEPRPYMPDGQKIAEAIQKDLADINVNAEIVSHEWATYLELAEKGEADAFLMGWTGANGDPDNFLYVLLDEDSIGSNNYTYFGTEKTHELFIDAQIESEQEKRNKLYEEAQEIIHDEAPWVPIAHSTPLLGAASDVINYEPHPTSADSLKHVDFE